MFCKECGKSIPDQSSFCQFCGAEQIGYSVSLSANRPARINSNVDIKPVALDQSEPSSGAKTLGGISLACGIGGLILFGIPLGIAAIACGIPAINGGAKNGIAGIILGIIDILLAIIILAAGWW